MNIHTYSSSTSYNFEKKKYNTNEILDNSNKLKEFTDNNNSQNGQYVNNNNNNNNRYKLNSASSSNSSGSK